MELTFEQLAHQWIKANRTMLRKYKGQWIAYNGTEGILAHHEDVSEVINIAKQKEKKYILKYLHPYTYSGLPKLLPIRFRALRNELWEPIQSVKVKYKGNEMVLDMLVDSGANFLTISNKVGKELGFKTFEDERPQKDQGVGGTISYVIRYIDVEIEGLSFEIPVGWFLDESSEDLLLGREVVFDAFDIEFKQKEEVILFKKRLDFTSFSLS